MNAGPAIVVPVDFSDASREALAYACAFAEATGGRVCAIHVLDPPWTHNVTYAVPPASTETRLFAAAVSRLNAELADAGAPADTPSAVRVGEPAAEILRYAVEARAQVIVMGVHGWHGADRLRLGRLTRLMLHESPCPVITLRTCPEHTFTNPVSLPT